MVYVQRERMNHKNMVSNIGMQKYNRQNEDDCLKPDWNGMWYGVVEYRKGMGGAAAEMKATALTDFLENEIMM